MAPAAPANLTPKERAARKAVLTRSIRIRQAQIARWRLYVQDEWLTAAIGRLEREIEQLQGERARLDSLDPDHARQVGRTYLGGR